MLTSIFSDNFWGVGFIFIIEYIIWGILFFKLRKLIKPINIPNRLLSFFSFLMFVIIIGGFSILFDYHDYYHDQSFVENGKIPPFKIYTELISCLFAFISTRIDWNKDQLRFQKKHKIILTEDDDNDDE